MIRTETYTYTSQDARSALLSLKFPKLSVPYGEREALHLPRYPAHYVSNLNRDMIEAREALDCDLFSLVGPEGVLILPRFWSQTIQPDWNVELQFDDIISWPGKDNAKSNNLDKMVVRQSQAIAGVENSNRTSSSRLGRFFKR